MNERFDAEATAEAIGTLLETRNTGVTFKEDTHVMDLGNTVVLSNAAARRLLALARIGAVVKETVAKEAV